MMVAALFALCLCSALAPQEFRVELTNQREFLVDAAVLEEGTWSFEAGGGTVRMPAQQVQSVTKLETEDAPAAEPAEAQAAAPAPAEATARQRFEIGGRQVEATIPAGFSRARSEEPAIVAFVNEDESESVRFAKSTMNGDLWSIGPAVKALHKKNYHEFRVLTEHFTTFAERPAWILCFEYRKGERRWQECQGFVATDAETIVISATVPADSGRRAHRLVQGIANSILPAAVGNPR